ncbi:MAG: N-methyl-L-tryptophan oxidase [Planctomycetaceae bacterium]|nr:N-methyl-L-tryptophan oxidase [Planctomycetaceae bacterium]
MSETRSRFDVIVLGVGAMGSATCLELARRGKRVLGLERHAIGHGLGSSHGGSRIIRECYFEAAEYVPLLLACREGWERLEHDAGQQLVHRPGVLYAGGPQSEVVRRSLSSGAMHGVPCELWTASEAMRRFPQFHLPDGWGALFEPGAGFVRPERAVLAATALARSLGAEVHENERATAWSETPSGVRVTTDRATYEADSLVIAAGAWTPSLARDVGVRLQPLRVSIAWLKPALPGACASPRMPAWYIDRPGLSGLYGIPTADDQTTGRRRVRAVRRRSCVERYHLPVHHESGPALRGRPHAGLHAHLRGLRLQWAWIQVHAGHGTGAGGSGL